MKKKYSLQFAHKFVIGVLIVLAFLFLMNPRAYVVETKNPEKITFDFLQAGDYVLELDISQSPAGNEVVVYTEQLTDSRNHPGVEFVRQNVPEGAGLLRIPLHLEQGTYGLEVSFPAGEESGCTVSRVRLQSVQLLCRDHYLMGVLCFAGAALAALLGLFVPAEKYKMPLALLGMALLSCLPLANDVLIQGHDTAFHVTRLEAVYQGLRAGEFPVRIGSVQMAGFGSLSATMYPQMFLYPFALPRFAGVSLMLCYKLLLAAINVGSAFLAYAAAKHICRSDQIGFWTAALYTFSLYRLENVYLRGALGESLAMVFLPLVLWGSYELFWGDRKKWYLLMMGMTGVLQSHVLTFEICILFLAACALFWLVTCRAADKGLRLLDGVKAAAGTVLLNAFFLVPFLYFFGEELQCFDMPNDIAETTLYFTQMFFGFASVEGDSLALGTMEGEMPLTVGTVLLLGAVLFVAAGSGKAEKTREGRVGRFCLGCAAAALVLSSWLFPWGKLQRVSVLREMVTSLQFAWRFLGIASVFLCMVTAIGIKLYEERHEDRWIRAVILVLTLCSTMFFFENMVQTVGQTNDKMAVNGYGYTDSMYMYSDGTGFKAHHLDYGREAAYILSSDEGAQYSDYSRRGSGLQVNVIPGSGTGSLRFPLYYFPGYEVSVNGEPVEVYAEDSRVACAMPAQPALVEVRYAGLPGFRTADAVSLVSLLGFAGYRMWKEFHKRRKKG